MYQLMKIHIPTFIFVVVKFSKIIYHCVIYQFFVAFYLLQVSLVLLLLEHTLKVLLEIN